MFNRKDETFFAALMIEAKSVPKTAGINGQF